MPDWIWNLITVLILPPLTVALGAVWRLWNSHNEIRLQVLGVKGENGLLSEMANLNKWREEFRADLPDLLTKARHDAVGQLMPKYMDLENRIRELEKRRR